MKISGRFAVDTKPNAMWALLHEAAALKNAIPRCQTVIKESDCTYAMTVRQAIAPMLGPARARLEYKRQVAPASLDCTINGSLSMAKFAGQATIRLEPNANGTAILVEMDILVPVIIERFFGDRLSEKIQLELRRFFNRMADHSRALDR